MFPRLQSGMEAAGQRAAGSAVHRCQSECGGAGPVCEVSHGGGTGAGSGE